MGSDSKKKVLGAEKLERRLAPGRLSYDVPEEEGSGDSGTSSVDTSPKDQKQRKGGRNRTQEIVAE